MSGPRIIAGDYRGRVLKTPKNQSVRPTPSAVREALFGIVESRLDFDGIRAVDICAGSGALGIEALSRGVAHVTFIDRDPSFVKENLAAIGVPESRFTLIRSDIARLEGLSLNAELILADPPYNKGLAQGLLEKAGLFAAPHSFWAIETERRAKLELPAGFTLIRHRPQGQGALWVLEKS